MLRPPRIKNPFEYYSKINSNQNQTNYFTARLKVDQRKGQLSLPHLGITNTEKIELKHKTDEQISPVNVFNSRGSRTMRSARQTETD